MGLQIRRGLEANRSEVTPAEGEFLYTTDQTKLYIGDGTTPGGTLITGSGIGNIVEDTTPQLGGQLDVNGFEIFSTDTNHIALNPRGTGEIKAYGDTEFTGNLKSASTLVLEAATAVQVGSVANAVDGRLIIVRNTYSSALTGGFSFQQHHDTVDATNFTFYRSRGTSSVPTIVQDGDDIIDLTFLGQSSSGIAPAAGITVSVEGTPTTRVPAKISFLTDNGTNTGVRAELSSAGVWKVNSIQNYSGTDLTITATNVKIAGDVQINAQSDLRFADSDNSNWVAFQAPAAITSNVTWTLPSSDGSSGQVLGTNGSGVLTWTDHIAGGIGLTSRSTLVPVTTSSLTDGQTENITITGYKGYILYKIETDAAAWVRLYTSDAARTADASRLEGTDPLPGAGVIAEVVTTGSETILISPGVIGFSDESTPTTAIPCTITNKSGVTTTITVALTALKIEI